MSSIDHQMAEIYCFVDDFFKNHPLSAGWRHSPNSHPAFTDSEVITIGLLQGPLGCSTLKQAYLLVRENWHSAFPHLCSYKQWLGRLHKLQAFVGQLICSVPLAISEADEFYLIDSKPVPLCHPLRHGKVRLLREDGAWFGKTSKGWFFGFKLHMLTSAQGQIISAVFTPANWDDRDPAPCLCIMTDGGLVLADLGYRGKSLEQSLFEEAEVLLMTVADGGPPKSRGRRLLSSVRERIETSFSQLWNCFIDRVYSRSWNGLWNTIKLKMLHYNLCHAGILSV